MFRDHFLWLCGGRAPKEAPSCSRASLEVKRKDWLEPDVIWAVTGTTDTPHWHQAPSSLIIRKLRVARATLFSSHLTIRATASLSPQALLPCAVTCLTLAYLASPVTLRARISSLSLPSEKTSVVYSIYRPLPGCIKEKAGPQLFSLGLIQARSRCLWEQNPVGFAAHRHHRPQDRYLSLAWEDRTGEGHRDFRSRTLNIPGWKLRLREIPKKDSFLKKAR